MVSRSADVTADDDDDIEYNDGDDVDDDDENADDAALAGPSSSSSTSITEAESICTLDDILSFTISSRLPWDRPCFVQAGKVVEEGEVRFSYSPLVVVVPK